MIEHLKANGITLNERRPLVEVPLRFDPKTERFIGNEKANALLTRDYRHSFVVPKLA